MNKYLFLYRNPQTTTSDRPPSPDEMKAMMTAWEGWKSSWKSNILDLGDGLKPTGKVLKAGVVSDGAHVQARELVGGYSIVQAESYDQAVAVAKACPINAMPGAFVEVRELAGFG